MAVVSEGSRTANAARTAQGTENVNFTLPNNEDHIILGCGVGDANGDELRVGDGVRLQFRKAAEAFVDVGAATVTVSTTNVDSDSIILTGLHQVTNTASGFSRHIEVKSINPGVAFTIGVADSVAIARDTAVMWLIFRTQ